MGLDISALKGAFVGAMGSVLLCLGQTAHAETEYTATTIAEGLDHPWCIAFLPNGDYLVTERAGRLRLIKDGALDEEPIAGAPETYVRSQGGYFDILLHPQYAENNIVYLSYAHGDRRANATRIARATFDGTTLNGLEAVFTIEPTKDTPNHYGGRMIFLADGTLMMTSGDGFDYREKAQVLDSLLGKVVRLNDDGTVPEDNPFVGQDGARPEIWSYGHRNPQGLTLDTDTGAVYLNEHGPRGGDELNLIEPGKNYGWPVITYGVDYSGAKISPFTEMDGMEQPLTYWVPSNAPSSLAYYGGDKFPEWRGDLLSATLVDKDVKRIDMEDGKVVGEESLFSEIGDRIRDVKVSPDGNIYLLTDKRNGAVIRIEPK